MIASRHRLVRVILSVSSIFPTRNIFSVPKYILHDSPTMHLKQFALLCLNDEISLLFVGDWSNL